jgi:hypothetical protein
LHLAERDNIKSNLASELYLRLHGQFYLLRSTMDPPRYLTWTMQCKYIFLAFSRKLPRNYSICNIKSGPGTYRHTIFRSEISGLYTVYGICMHTAYLGAEWLLFLLRDRKAWECRGCHLKLPLSARVSLYRMNNEYSPRHPSMGISAKKETMIQLVLYRFRHYFCTRLLMEPT